MAKQPTATPPTSKIRRNRIEPISGAVARITKPVFGRRGLADGVIARDWAAIVGEVIAQHSQPERITYAGRERTGGLLHLRVDNSAMATQLQHLEPQLVERINTHFGYRAVARLRYLHAPLPEPTLAPRRQRVEKAPSLARKKALAEALSGIDDPDLLAALERLGRAIDAGHTET
jgi:hypothetical protein